MPYAMMSELPAAVQEMPEQKRKQWMAAFNAANADGKTEEECAKIAWAAVKESFDAVEFISEQATLSKSAPDGNEDGWVWEAEMLKPGESLNGFRYTPQFIAEAAREFEGSPAHADHQETAGGSIRSWIGNWKNVRAEGSLKGRLHLLKSENWIREKLLAAAQAGVEVGVSVSMIVAAKKVQEGGRTVVEPQKIVPKTPRSADLVMFPSAGGRVLRAVAGEEFQVALERARKEFLLALPADKPSSAGSNQGGAMKEAIQRILESLRGIATDGAKTAVTAIEAELAKETPKYDELLTRATEALALAAKTATTAVQDGLKPIQADVKKLQDDLAAAQKGQRVAESQLLIKNKIAESKLPEPLAQLMRERYEGQEVDAAQLEGEIKRVRKAYAAVAASPGRISHVPAQVLLESSDKMQIGLHRMLGVTHDWTEVREGGMVRMARGAEIDKAVPSFRGIKEAYIAYTGDEDVAERVREEFDSSQFPNALAASLYRLMLQGYAEVDYGLDLIVPQGNRRSVPDFKTQERIRVGYFGDLATLDPESADYAEITAPTDEKASYAVVQFGGIVSVTRKTIKNDDLGFLSRIVTNLGRAARRTLAQRVMNMMINNVAIYDAVTWAHASSHGANLRTTALSATEMEALARVMYAQTEKDAAKTLGIETSILIVPRALTATAKTENERQYLDDQYTPNPARFRFGPNSERIITSPLLTDATDFYWLADQNQTPCIEVGFMDGRQEPEFFLADNPVVGKMFTSDRIQYKVRHEHEAVVTDYRGFGKSVVAG